MRSIINKIFSYQTNLNEVKKSFLELTNNSNAKVLFEILDQHEDNIQIRYVGGCVRKILSNEDVNDIDLAINITPEKLIDILKKNKINYFDTGISHGTITISIEKKHFEITTLRKDILTDGRHAKVKFSDNWLEDASRRDFTINCIYSDHEGNLFDPFNGKKDLEDGKLNFIGDPEKRIKEDYLRILRYVRFFLNYSRQKHDSNVKKIIKQNIKGVKNQNSERLIDEIKKLVKSKGFLKINNDEFCKEVILLIFPQLKKIQIYKNLNKYAEKIYLSQNFIFLISLMIIDETDNSDYFLYKFKLSNNDQKKVKFLKEIFSEKNNKKIFNEKKLWEIFYYKSKDDLIDILKFEIFKNKKINYKLIKLLNFFKDKEKPIFPINGKDIMLKYDLKEGRELGDKLKKIENVWIKNGFRISHKDIDKLIKN